jgi:hemolysin activation/secretion protein
LSALALAGVSGPALSQSAPAAPPPAAAVQGAPTREEVTRPEAVAAPRARSRLTVEGGIQRAPCALADARFAGLTIPFREALFDHLRSVSPDVLRPAWQPYVGKTVPIATVCEIRDAAATILRRQGYLAAVQVPPQRIEGGTVHFDVLLPRLVAVHVRGDAGKSAHLIAAYLNKLVGRETFNQNEAERYLLLVRDLPGYDVRLTLRPAADGVAGDVVGEVSVLRQPYAVDLNVQDYGSQEVGRVGGLLRAEAYDLFGLGDRLTAGVFSTSDFSEQQVYQGAYEFRLGGEGLTITADATWARTTPDLAQNLDVLAHTLFANVGARYPFFRSQAANLSGAAGFDLVDQNVHFSGLPLTHDHIRTAYARLFADATDPASVRAEGGYSASEPRWRLSGLAEVRHGLDVLDATDRCRPLAECVPALGGRVPPSRLDARPRATIVRLSGTAEYRPTPRIAFVLSPTAQYSQQPTLSYEQFSAGNYTVGRGYDAGAIQGDSGVGFSGELRYGSSLPKSASTFSFQPYAFIDAAWTKHNGAGFANEREHLVSTGGGVRAAWGARARADVAVAVPLDKVGTFDRRGDTRVLFSLTTRLLPWRR